MTVRTLDRLRFPIAALLLAAAGVFLHAHSSAEVLPPQEDLGTFPLNLGSWSGMDMPIQPGIREVLGDGEFLSRIYRRTAAEPPIDLFLAYFASQRTGSTIHSPQHCLPGAGWLPIKTGRLALSGTGREPVMVNVYVIAKGLDRSLALYWYQAHGRVVTSEYWAKFYLVTDAIRTNRSDGALLRIITPLGQGEGVGSAQSRAVEFAQQLIPLLDRYIPR